MQEKKDIEKQNKKTTEICTVNLNNDFLIKLITNKNFVLFTRLWFFRNILNNFFRTKLYKKDSLLHKKGWTKGWTNYGIPNFQNSKLDKNH